MNGPLEFRSCLRRAPGTLAGLAVILALASIVPAVYGATAFRIPTPETRTLDNGLRVAVFPSSRLPVVQVLLLIPAGSSEDPPGHSGVAGLAAEMLRHGTSSRDAAAYTDELDRLGTALLASASRDFSTVGAAFLSSDLEAGLELMSDAVLNPVFDVREFDRVRAQTLKSVAQLRRDPANFAGEQLGATLFADHPYAGSVTGTEESLRGLTPDDLREFAGRHYRPDGAILAIAGDVSASRAFTAAAEWFGRWEGKSTPSPDRPLSPTPSGDSPRRLRIRLFDAPELHDAEICFGLVTPARGDADELPLELASTLIGGGSSSRLARLPAAGTLGRVASCLQSEFKDAGIFRLGVTIGSDSVRIAIDRLRDEVRRFIDGPLEESEVAPVRRTALNLMPVQFDTPGGLLSHWCASQFYGLPEGSYDRTRERLASLAPDQIVAAARRWFDPDRFTIVVVGPGAAIAPQLEGLGDIEVVRLGQPDATARPPAPGSEPPAAPPTAAQIARGREIVRRAIIAHGGLARLRRVKDSTVEADATLILGGKELHGRVVQIRKEPYRMLFSTSIEGVDTDQTLNGDRAWSISSGASEAVPAEMDEAGVRGMRTSFTSDVPHLLLSAADRADTVASLGTRSIGDRRTDAVEVRAPEGRRVLYFEPGTHRLVAMDQNESSEPGGGFSARRLYGDLRQVGGILWPHSEERLLGGETVMRLSVTRVSLDRGVADTIFEKPEPALPPPAR